MPNAAQVRGIVLNNDAFLGIVPNTGNNTGAGKAQFLVPFDCQTLDSVEVNYSKKFADKNKMKIDANAYYNTYNHLTIYNGADGGDVFLPKFSSVGLELVYGWQINDKSKIDVSYSYSKPLGVDDTIYNLFPVLTTVNHNDWTQYPTHMIKAAITQQMLKDKLVIGGDAEYFSNPGAVPDSQYAAWTANNGVPGAPDYNGQHAFVNPTIRVNIAARYAITDNFFAKLIVKNLFADPNPVSFYYYAAPSSGQSQDGDGITQFHLQLGYKL